MMFTYYAKLTLFTITAAALLLLAAAVELLIAHAIWSVVAYLYLIAATVMSLVYWESPEDGPTAMLRRGAAQSLFLSLLVVHAGVIVSRFWNGNEPLTNPVAFLLLSVSAIGIVGGLILSTIVSINGLGTCAFSRARDINYNEKLYARYYSDPVEDLT